MRTHDVEADGWHRFTAHLPLVTFTDGRAEEESGGHGDRWSVALVRGNGKTHLITAPAGIEAGRLPLVAGPGNDGAARNLHLSADPCGHLLLADQAAYVLADAVSWTTDGELLIEGSYAGASPSRPDLVWQHSGHRREFTVGVDLLEGGRFSTRLRPSAMGSQLLPLPEGRWSPFLRTIAGGRTVDMPLRLASARQELPLPHRGADRVFAVNRSFHDRMSLQSGSVLSDSERGPYRQHRLATVHYPASRARPVADAVLYNSFDGRQYSDSPRAVHEEFVRRGVAVEHLWTVSDGQATPPSTARTVVLGSAEWHEALARSRYIVGNTQFPTWFERREEQVAVQTWHGTPLKRIGLDLADMPFADHRYIEGLARRSAHWSFLLAPNTFSVPIMRRAFGYDGEVLEAGYPRNDLFYAADRGKRAAQVRERLGLPEGRRVVLYAPTWRDDARYKGGAYKFDLRIDLSAAEAALGRDHVLLI
ncbi:CDP-glycerol glycerophosphotransferase family protein, partial [Streptomyces sp. NPDC059956]|uniref:CDP-glycerol glycerophosphotransferase family protein n=1 Tax=Streptomyces sp. NPDC059956 TaxID=3347015 RepID=UPI00364E3F54